MYQTGMNRTLVTSFKDSTCLIIWSVYNIGFSKMNGKKWNQFLFLSNNVLSIHQLELV